VPEGISKDTGTIAAFQRLNFVAQAAALFDCVMHYAVDVVNVDIQHDRRRPYGVN
jgi:hypothetical protein